MVILVNDSQALNIMLLIIVKLLDKVTFDKEVHKRNTPSPTVTTLSGIITVVNEVQLWNARKPIYVTPLGMVTLVSKVFQDNDLSPIAVTG